MKRQGDLRGPLWGASVYALEHMGCKKAYPRFLVSRLWVSRISPIKPQIQIQIPGSSSSRDCGISAYHQ